MKAVILAGGFGTRLHPLTKSLPKPILPILNQPFLEHYLNHLGEHGVNQVYLTLYHLPEMIQQHFGNRYRDISLNYTIEGEPLGTAGGVKALQSWCDDTFVVGNGDIFTNVDLSSAIKFHKDKKAAATLILTQVSDPTSFGMVETDSDSRIIRFIEKPSPNEVTTHWVNGGTYILEPHVLGHLPYERPVMFEHDLFPGMLKIGEPMYAFKSEAYWLDMGTRRNYLKLHKDLLEGTVSGPDMREKDNQSIVMGEECYVHPSATLNGPILLGAGCQIGPDSRITGPVTIGDGCTISARVQISNAVVWSQSNLGFSSALEGCIVGKAVTVQDGAHVGADCILGNYSMVSAGKQVPVGFSLEPMVTF